MNSNVMRTFLALGLVLYGTAVSASSSDFTFESRTIPIGKGFPKSGPIDINGFYAGITGDDAIKQLAKFYGENRGGAGIRHTVFPFSETKSATLILPEQFDVNAAHDVITLALSNKPSGNQVYGIGRDIQYTFEGAPLLSVFTESLYSKYGNPTYTERVKGSDGHNIVRIHYVYYNGKIFQGKDESGLFADVTSGREACFYQPRFLGQLDRLLHVSSRAVIHPFMPRSASDWARWISASLRDGMRKGVSPCSGIFRIDLYNAVGRRGGPVSDENRVIAARMTFIDVERFMFSNNRDYEVQESFKAKANAANTIKPNL